MQSIFRKFSISLIILSLLLPISMGRAAPSGQAVTGNERAQALLDQLTPEERVGQLFLVTFIGPEAGIGSATGAQIYDLIVNYHIGGVILTSANDNFIGSDQTLVFAQSLTDQLQSD